MKVYKLVVVGNCSSWSLLRMSKEADDEGIQTGSSWSLLRMSKEAHSWCGLCSVCVSGDLHKQNYRVQYVAGFSDTVTHSRPSVVTRVPRPVFSGVTASLLSTITLCCNSFSAQYSNAVWVECVYSC
jgi:hypothetical protein